MPLLPRTLIITLVVTLIPACDSKTQLNRLHADAVILAFGDSLTEGKGAPDSESYPAILSQLSGRTVINEGRSGELSSEGLRRISAVLDRHTPDLVIICHGGNDILRKLDLNRMRANVEQMINIARGRGLPVVLLGVPRPGLLLSTAEQYSEIADSTGVIFVEDLVADVLGNNSMKSDIAHPNATGYREIAEKLYDVLRDYGAL